MSKVALSSNPSGAGTFTIASPNGNTDRTVILPDSNGTILTTATAGVPVNGPAFSAYAGSNLALTGNVSTKVQLSSELFDSNNCFDNSTNYRFTPNVAGYYQINFSTEASTGAASYYVAQLKKNGSFAAYGSNFPTSAGAGQVSAGSTLLYMNGVTDYIELFVQSTATVTVFNGVTTAMNGFLARSAT